MLARSMLSALAYWAHHPVLTGGGGVLVHPDESDSSAQAALRALSARHHEERPPRVVAFAEAMATLERLGAVAAFEAWRTQHKGSAGSWPTAEYYELRARFRAVVAEPIA